MMMISRKEEEEEEEDGDGQYCHCCYSSFQTVVAVVAAADGIEKKIIVADPCLPRHVPLEPRCE